MDETEGAVPFVQTPSEISLSLISQANIVGFSLLYDSILFTTRGVATFGFDPPITELWVGGLKNPCDRNKFIIGLGEEPWTPPFPEFAP